VRGRSLPLRAGENLIAMRGGGALFERDELVAEFEARGFEEIRQRMTGITQFIGGRLPE
jgi:hypothetical protein